MKSNHDEAAMRGTPVVGWPARERELELEPEPGAQGLALSLADWGSPGGWRLATVGEMHSPRFRKPQRKKGRYPLLRLQQQDDGECPMRGEGLAFFGSLDLWILWSRLFSSIEALEDLELRGLETDR